MREPPVAAALEARVVSLASGSVCGVECAFVGKCPTPGRGVRGGLRPKDGHNDGHVRCKIYHALLLYPGLMSFLFSTAAQGNLKRSIAFTT